MSPENLVTVHSVNDHADLQSHVTEQNQLGYALVEVLHFSGNTYIFFWERTEWVVTG